VRFPFANVPMVQKRLEAVFRRRGISTLVCLAACGADLAALKIAGTLGLRRRIVLPFPPERFRRTSVTDRPGNWGGLYDRIIAQAMAAGGPGGPSRPSGPSALI
jgi:hypothetical protein